MGKSASVSAVKTTHDGYSVPLSSLIRSPVNVRTTNQANRIAELAASIAAHGLIMPLSVTEQKKKGKATGIYEVIAGARRLQALLMLAEQGKIEADAAIDCIVFDSADAVSVSIAENDGQEPMHPADQCDAFKMLIAQGRDIKHVAGQFGVTEAFVERRLRLANVAPEIVQEFRAGKASLAQMMALAVTSDNAAQLAVWKASSTNSWMREPGRLRAALVADRIPGDHPMINLVGVESYQKAGGAIESDLFGVAGSFFILDPKLLKQLANDLMQKAARKVVGKRSCAWIDCDFEPGHHHTHDRVELVPAPLTAEQLAARAAIQEQIDVANKAAEALEFSDDLTDEDEAALDALNERIEQLSQQFDAIRNGAGSIPDDLVPLIGAVIRLGSDGKATTSYPVTRVADRKAVEAITRKAQQARVAAERAVTGEAETSTDTGPQHSDALSRTLTGAKTLGLQAALAVQTETAIRMLAHTLVERHLVDYQFNYGGPALGIRFERANVTDDMRAAAPAAVDEIQRVEAKWRQVLPDDDAAREQWFLQVDFQTILQVLAYVTAMQINVIQFWDKSGGSESLAPYAQSINYDARAWFTPTAANYFGRVNKNLMLASLTDAGVGAEDLAKVAKAKKAEAAAMAEQLVADGRWVPSLVRVD